MNIARFFVSRPVFTVMTTLIVIVLGMVSLTRLPIDLMPDITYPTLSVITNYSNVSPEEIEKLITRPIEEAVSSVTGVEEVTSVSTEGSSQVRVTFTWGTNLDAASNDIRDRLDRIVSRLPEEADRPMLRKFDLAAFPILILGASSSLNPVEMRQIVEDQIQHRIERLPGIASLEIVGGQSREIHVCFYADKIKALNLPLEQIISRIKAGNVTLPAGPIERSNYEITIRTQGEYQSLDEIRNTVVAIREGAPVLVREVADVLDYWQKIRQLVYVNGKPGIRLGVRKQSGTNTVEVASRVLKEIPKINADIPQVQLTPIIDTSDYIKRSITNVGSSAMNGGLLAIFVLLVFLRSVRSTVVISLAIPISIIATFALMYFCGFTLNLMTLGGLALGVGMLVDNSIVVLENIYRIHEGGKNPKDAAILGTAEVVYPIIASTLTTLVVFLPLVFVRGMAGVMFQQLAYVISFSLVCSLWVSLTLVPMLASKILKGTDIKKAWYDFFFKTSEKIFLWVEEGYRDLLGLSLNHSILVGGATILSLGGVLFLVPLIGVELMPETDESEVRVSLEMDVGTRIDLTREKCQEVYRVIKESVPEVRNVVMNVGGSPWRASGIHTAEVRVSLVPSRERKRSSQDIAADLRKKLSRIPGAVMRTRAGQGLFLLRMGSGGGEKIEIEIRGHDLEIADALAAEIKKRVERLAGVSDVVLSRESGSTEEIILVDRQKAADMKLTMSQIASMLETVLGGTRASDYREGGNEYRILVKLHNAEKHKIRDILDLTLNNAEGEPIVLRNVIKVDTRIGAVRINRKDQQRVVTVAVNTTADRDLSFILEDIREEMKEVPLPQNFSIEFGGDYEEQQKAFVELSLGFVLSLVLVYMVMACQYESLRHPLIVMFSVPLAIIGVVIVLFLTNTTFNVQSFIGCIMLGGIVVNNAILLVDHTNLVRETEGLELREAIEEAGRRRLRPILMTALTTILGLFPLSIGIGEGGEAQAPLARVVIGGLISSTFITLIFIPIVYGWVERIRKAWLRP